MPSQYIDLTSTNMSISLARPINTVATVPGYRFGTPKWTTRNTETVPVPQTLLSPEVAQLLKTIGQPKSLSSSARVLDTVQEPALIRLDADPLSPVVLAGNDTTLEDMREAETPTRDEDMVPHNNSESSDDSTAELLNELLDATDSNGHELKIGNESSDHTSNDNNDNHHEDLNVDAETGPTRNVSNVNKGSLPDLENEKSPDIPCIAPGQVVSPVCKPESDEIDSYKC